MTPEQQEASLRRAHGAIKGGNFVNRFEARVCQILNGMDLAYQLHKVVGPYVADLCIPAATLFVECDGEYWHGRAHMKGHDAARDAYMAEHGYRVLRIPEQATQDEIEAILREAMT